MQTHAAAYERRFCLQAALEVLEHWPREIDALDVDASARDVQGDAAVADAVFEDGATGASRQPDVVIHVVTAIAVRSRIVDRVGVVRLSAGITCHTDVPDRERLPNPTTSRRRIRAGLGSR
jgi:hypothetical protein